jgi:hypothetical protein
VDTPASLQTELDGLIDRFKFEHELLVNRTNAILTLNGLMAAAEALGTGLPNLARLVVALVMIVIDLLWWWRALRATNYIKKLATEMYGGGYDSVLPRHATIHKHNRSQIPFSSDRLFATVISFGLIICWMVGLLSVAFA